MKDEHKGGLSRRGFLKALGLGGASLAASAAALPARALAAQEEVRTLPGQELATLHDLSRCVGCGACVEACRESNGFKYPEPQKPFPEMYPPRVKAEDWSEKRDVDDRLTPYNWLFLQSAEVEQDGETYEINIPRRCMHCQNPPCANLCPWGAAGREKNGIVRINDQVCLGGSKCKSVCPWHIPQRQTGVGLYLDILPRFAGNGVMYKCDRCHQLVAEGQAPACVSACPYDVQTIGPREEIVQKAHELAESMNGYIYGEHENGGTNTLYVSPVPFDKLHAALKDSQQIDSKKGRPGLEPFPDMMSAEENMAEAALIAPFAGIAAGLVAAGRAMFGRGEASGRSGAPGEGPANNESRDKEGGHED
ncbi:4Fe-4S dicluster domain-containing protein [Paucidesulfovibrio longus]|uniref:4Fe-4S dicluster domain-containing protein n=1 Tax=Paucidesulfovibrio longus TaxID=889 RepID=UPI0003B7848F|nr:4Fe-4S dicluster domain-containing protein [Paucidesulfovibrio longus]